MVNGLSVLTHCRPSGNSGALVLPAKEELATVTSQFSYRRSGPSQA
jgi:hypothetical protein